MRAASYRRILCAVAAVLTSVIAIPAISADSASTSSLLRITYISTPLTPNSTGEVFAQVPTGERCQLAISAGKVVSRSRTTSSTNGSIEYFWRVPSHISSGVRVAVETCSHRRTSALINVNGNVSGEETKITSAIRADVPKSSEPTTSTGRGAAAYPAYGTVLIAWNDWFDGDGVNVYSNGQPPNYDGYYQCVELANRFMITRHFGPAIYGNANQLYADAQPAYYDRYPNGSGYVPVPGDLIVLGGTTYGHVVVVDSVTSSEVYVVEQNASASGLNEISLSGSTLGSEYGMNVIGIIHAKANVQSSTTPTSPPTTTSTAPPTTTPTSPPTTTPTSPPGTVPPTYYTFQIVIPGASSGTVNERSGPGTNYSVAGTLSDGATIQIACQTSGTPVGSPVSTSVWDQLSSGAYVSDFYTNTPVAYNFSPPIPRC